MKVMVSRGGIFALVAFGAAFGAVSGAMAVGKSKRKMKQQPYAAIGSGLIATGVAALAYNPQTCPPCPAGTIQNGPTPKPPMSRGAFTASVAAASVVGAVAGTVAIGKQKPSKLLGQQPYAPIGAALASAGLAAILLPDPPVCPPCLTPVTTPTPTTPGPTTPAPTPPSDQNPPR